MDAPPAKEDMEPYIRIASMLVDVGVNAPRVLERNDEEGFLLNSDLGSQTYLMELDAQRRRGPAVRRCHRSAGAHPVARARRMRRACRPTTTRCCGGRWGCFPSGSAAGISA